MANFSSCKSQFQSPGSCYGPHPILLLPAAKIQWQPDIREKHRPMFTENIILYSNGGHGVHALILMRIVFLGTSKGVFLLGTLNMLTSFCHSNVIFKIVVQLTFEDTVDI